jgi:hypothetical protein
MPPARFSSETAAALNLPTRPTLTSKGPRANLLFSTRVQRCLFTCTDHFFHEYVIYKDITHFFNHKALLETREHDMAIPTKSEAHSSNNI